MKTLLFASFSSLFLIASAGAGNLYFYDNSQIDAGTVFGSGYSYNSAIVKINGGQGSDFFITNSSAVNMYAGEIQRIWLQDSGSLNLYGGNITGYVTPSLPFSGTIKINVYGYGFQRGTINYPDMLTGFWADGTAFNIHMRDIDMNANNFHLNVVPEPATLILLSVGALLLRRNSHLS